MAKKKTPELAGPITEVVATLPPIVEAEVPIESEVEVPIEHKPIEHRMGLLFTPEGYDLVIIPKLTPDEERIHAYDKKHDQFYEVALLTTIDGEAVADSIAPVPSTTRMARGIHPPVKVLPHVPLWAKLPVDTEYELKIFQQHVVDFLADNT